MNSVFLLLGRFPYQGQRTSLLFTHCWKLNCWIHTFPKWNSNSHFQDFNPGHRIYFLQRYPYSKQPSVTAYKDIKPLGCFNYHDFMPWKNQGLFVFILKIYLCTVSSVYTKQHLIVRLQFWRFWEYRVPIYCHYSDDHSNSQWLDLFESYL